MPVAGRERAAPSRPRGSASRVSDRSDGHTTPAANAPPSARRATLGLFRRDRCVFFSVKCDLLD